MSIAVTVDDAETTRSESPAASVESMRSFKYGLGTHMYIPSASYNGSETEEETDVIGRELPSPYDLIPATSGYVLSRAGSFASTPPKSHSGHMAAAPTNLPLPPEEIISDQHESFSSELTSQKFWRGRKKTIRSSGADGAMTADQQKEALKEWYAKTDNDPNERDLSPPCKVSEEYMNEEIEHEKFPPVCMKTAFIEGSDAEDNRSIPSSWIMSESPDANAYDEATLHRSQSGFSERVSPSKRESTGGGEKS